MQIFPSGTAATILLIDMDFGHGDLEHALYGVPLADAVRARAAAEQGCAAWKAAGATDRRTLEEFIDQALSAAGIRFESLDFDAIPVDC